jgi:predicted ArsR family transcriptional regulator
MDAIQSAAAVYQAVEPGQDRASAYADRVRHALSSALEPLSVKELKAVCSLSERLVRDGLERLQMSGELVMAKKYVANRRGPPALVYRLRQS